MPARKNRPDKCGLARAQAPKISKRLLDFLRRCEMVEPGATHYVPWDMVDEADYLSGRGTRKGKRIHEPLLQEGSARGCYKITHEGHQVIDANVQSTYQNGRNQ